MTDQKVEQKAQPEAQPTIPEVVPVLPLKGTVVLPYMVVPLAVGRSKSLAALDETGLTRLVVAGGVGANRRLRERLAHETERRGAKVFYPDLQFCTDSGAMIALVGALRMEQGKQSDLAFTVRPRWDLSSVVR